MFFHVSVYMKKLSTENFDVNRNIKKALNKSCRFDRSFVDFLTMFLCLHFVQRLNISKHSDHCSEAIDSFSVSQKQDFMPFHLSA